MCIHCNKAVGYDINQFRPEEGLGVVVVYPAAFDVVKGIVRQTQDRDVGAQCDQHGMHTEAEQTPEQKAKSQAAETAQQRLEQLHLRQSIPSADPRARPIACLMRPRFRG